MKKLVMQILECIPIVIADMMHTSNISLSLSLSLSHTHAHTYTVWLCLASLCVIDEEDIVAIFSG